MRVSKPLPRHHRPPRLGLDLAGPRVGLGLLGRERFFLRRVFRSERALLLRELGLAGRLVLNIIWLVHPPAVLLDELPERGAGRTFFDAADGERGAALRPEPPS